MNQGRQEDSDIKKMIADYMECGMLDNIIDMFKHDKSLYGYVGDLLLDERMRVRIGITALIEALREKDRAGVLSAIPTILPLLKNDSPVARGDAAYLLGIIGSKDVIPYLSVLENDENVNVRTIAQEAIEDIHARTE
ncbi:MAG: HEAT repeat domain-containing protein [Nitrospirota bacterium]